MIRVVVAGIPRPGLQIELDLGTEWVREAATFALDADPTALSGDLDIQVNAKRVSVRGAVQVTAPAACDRCSEEVVLDLESDIALSYLPEHDHFDAELELGADDLDVGWYRDGELDLGDVLREALALALPSRTTCSDSAGCDARTRALLEHESDDEGASSPFAALRALRQ